MTLNPFNLKPKSFALDISDQSFKMVNLEKKRRGFKLTSYGTFNIEKGIIKGGKLKNKRKLSSLLKEKIKDVEGEKIKTSRVIVALPEEKSFLKVVKMPKMAKEDLESAIIYEAEDYIPMNIEDAYVDFKIIPPAHGKPDHMHILIAALPKEIVTPYFQAIRKADLKPIAFEIESLSICRALMEKEKVEPPTLIIDLGLTKTSFVIYSGKSLRFTRTLPISSQQFTDKIAEEMDLGPEEAEKIKKKYGIGSSKNGKRIKKAIKENLNDLIEKIKEHLDYYNSYDFGEHLPPKMEREIKRIVLSGGGASLKGLPNFLKKKVGVSVELGNPLINISEKPLLNKEEARIYTTGLGLGLRNYFQKND